MKLNLKIHVPNPENEDVPLANIDIAYEASASEYITALQCTRESFKEIMELASDALPEILDMFQKPELEPVIPTGYINRLQLMNAIRDRTGIGITEAKEIMDAALLVAGPNQQQSRI